MGALASDGTVVLSAGEVALLRHRARVAEQQDAGTADELAALVSLRVAVSNVLAGLPAEGIPPYGRA